LHVLQNGRVSVKSLAASFGMSEPTIRRDLRALAAADQVKLVHRHRQQGRRDKAA